MRRALGLTLLVPLVVVLFVAPAAADDPGDVPAVFAVEGGDNLGPDPKPREAEDNPARELAGYENPDVPFTWGAAWILTFAGMAGLVLLAGLYYYGVYRPNRESSSR